MSTDNNEDETRRGEDRPWAPKWSSIDRRDFLLALGVAGAGTTIGQTEINETVSAESSVVVDINGNPVENARVSLLITDVTLDGVANDLRGHYRSVMTDTSGTFSFELSSDEKDEIRQLVVTAQKGNWFTANTYNTVDIGVPDNYGELTLDHQILSGPEAVRTTNDVPFGAVTVWRYLFDETTQVFFVEVANTNEHDHQSEWEIRRRETPGGGPASGIFSLSYPEERKIDIADEEAFADTDPTGSGNVEIFGTHGDGGYTGLMEKLFHPLRDYMELPMYTTTKRIGTGAPDSVEDPDGWSPITPETLEEAEEIEERVENALKMVGRSPGGKKSIGVLLDLKDILETINRFLDQEERVARLTKTPETPIVDGDDPEHVFDISPIVSGGDVSPIVGGGDPEHVFAVWESDYPTLSDRWENAVVFQVPLRIETDDPFEVSVLAEWTRPFNDRGEFHGTFATGPLDVAVTYPTSPVEPSEEYVMNTVIRNQSLTTRQVAEVRFEFGDALAELGTVSLSPNKEISPGDIWNPAEPRFKIPETDGRGTIDVTVIDADAVTASRSRNLFVEGNEEKDEEDPEDEDEEPDSEDEDDDESDDGEESSITIQLIDAETAKAIPDGTVTLHPNRTGHSWGPETTNEDGIVVFEDLGPFPSFDDGGPERLEVGSLQANAAGYEEAQQSLSWHPSDGPLDLTVELEADERDVERSVLTVNVVGVSAADYPEIPSVTVERNGKTVAKERVDSNNQVQFSLEDGHEYTVSADGIQGERTVVVEGDTEITLSDE